MPQAVQFNEYGDRDVLHVVDVPLPHPAAGEVVVEVVAAGINPGETNIRSGMLHDRWPATFPSGQGSDFAGYITAVGADVPEFEVGDQVLGWSDRRSSHASYVEVPASQIIRKPEEMSWESAGSLFVAGTTAYACVRAVDVSEGDVVVVSAAAGGVGSLAVQLVRRKGATVLGIASEPNHQWLEDHGVVPVAYGDGLQERIEAAAPEGVDAFIDLFGPEYVQLAVDLGVKPERINTIISWEKAAEVGAKTDGTATAATTEVLSELAGLVATGAVEVPIAATFPLDKVQDAFAELEERHTRGKIVLLP
jgi:NADPH2:quinone reductase